MELVSDEDGNRYEPLKRSASSYLVRDIETGRVKYIDRQRLTDHQVDPQTDFEQSDIDLSETRLHPISLQILQRIHSSSGQTARGLLDATTHCESDLFMILRDLELGGFVARDEGAMETEWTATPRGDVLLDRLDQSVLTAGETGESD